MMIVKRPGVFRPWLMMPTELQTDCWILAIHALSRFDARRFVMHAHRVERRDLTQPLHRVVQRIDNLVHPGDHDDLARSIADRCDTVAGTQSMLTSWPCRVIALLLVRKTSANKA